MNRAARRAVLVLAACALGRPVVPAAAQSQPASAPAESQPASAPATTASAPATASAAAVEEIAVSFSNMGMEQVAAFLSEKLDKPVIVSDAVKDKKVTVVAKQMMPLPQALQLLREAMLLQGVMVDEQERLIRLRPVSEALQAPLPRIPADRRAADLADPLAIVVKEFAVQYYPVGNLVEVVKPMLSGFGQILADPDSRRIFVTDSVAALQRIEVVIDDMDLPSAERTQTEIVTVEHGDAAEIVGIVRWLIAGRLGVNVTEIATAAGAGAPGGQPGRGGPPQMQMMPGQPGQPPGPPGGGAGPSVVRIEPSSAQVTLMPHILRNWIIVVAPADLMPQIRTWIAELDKAPDEEKDYELLDVQYADVAEIARQMTQTLQAMPNAEIRDTTHVVPFGQSKKVIVFGSRGGRTIVRDLLRQLDVEQADRRNRRTFTLEYADATEMAERIETLFSNLEMQSSYDYGYGSSRSYRTRENAASVTVVPDKRRNTITVITDSVTMDQIAALIAEEDKPIETGSVKPRVYELRYVDPGEMQTLLTEMFSEQDSGGNDFWSMYFGTSQQETKPIGRLLGQFTFQVLPSSRKLIVNSTSPTNFSVIDELIAELDQPQRAGLPDVIELKYANAEDLCEQINAILSEPGTLASVRRADRGLADRGLTGRGGERGSQPAPAPEGPGQPAQRSNPDDMTFWWQSFRPPQNAVPSSHLIGKIRIVPVYRRNAVMALAPEGYRESVRQMIVDMDQPSRQVLIQARVGEIEHDTQTTLGLRIASDPSILGAADTAIGGGGTARYQDVFGGTLTLSANANVAALLNLLIQRFDMQILLEPALTTSENEASEYFDGQDVPVQTQTRQSAEGTTTVTDIAYEQVGTRLRVRPHITQSGGVDLIINLEISRIVPGTTALGNFIFDRREVTTHVIVQSGQTIMLSGIIRQEDFENVRKVPLLGDIPGLGRLFRSIDTGRRNREMVVFITPIVMSTQSEVDTVMAGPRQTLDRVEDAFDDGADRRGPWDLPPAPPPVEEARP